MNIKENQRYQQTHQAITSALLKALERKDIKQVTVIELCRAVHINRSTFYEHFIDIYDVLEQLAESITAQALKRAPNGEPAREDFLFLLRHIQENKTFYNLFFHQNIPVNVQEKFFLSKQPPLPPNVILDARGIQSRVQLEYHQAFFQAGLDAILKKWLERDCAESPEEIYALLSAEYSLP